MSVSPCVLHRVTILPPLNLLELYWSTQVDICDRCVSSGLMREWHGRLRESNYIKRGRFPFWNLPHHTEEDSSHAAVAFDRSPGQLWSCSQRILLRPTSRRLCPDTQLLPYRQITLPNQRVRAPLWRRAWILGYLSVRNCFHIRSVVFLCIISYFI